MYTSEPSLNNVKFCYHLVHTTNALCQSSVILFDTDCDTDFSQIVHQIKKHKSQKLPILTILSIMAYYFLYYTLDHIISVGWPFGETFTVLCENENFLISSQHCFFANVTPCPLVLLSSLTVKKYFCQYFHIHSIF